jgi:hypothetical protein
MSSLEVSWPVAVASEVLGEEQEAGQRAAT